MSPKQYSAEQIISKLREAEVLLSQGKTIGETCRHLTMLTRKTKC